MGRIIVIEDNPVFADYVCRLLESKGFQSISTFNCNSARKLFAKMQEDDIVLADMRLPDGDWHRPAGRTAEARQEQSIYHHDGVWRNPHCRPVVEAGCGGLYSQKPTGNEFTAAFEILAETAGTARSTDLLVSEHGFP